MLLLESPRRLLVVGVAVLALSGSIGASAISAANPKPRLAAVQVREDQTLHGVAGVPCLFTFGGSGYSQAWATNSTGVAKSLDGASTFATDTRVTVECVWPTETALAPGSSIADFQALKDYAQAHGNVDVAGTSFFADFNGGKTVVVEIVGAFR